MTIVLEQYWKDQEALRNSSMVNLSEQIRKRDSLYYRRQPTGTLIRNLIVCIQEGDGSDIAIIESELNTRFTRLDFLYHEEMRVNAEDEAKARQT